MRLAEEWAGLQAKYRAAYEALQGYRYELRAKYRDEHYCSRGERKRIERLDAAQDRAYARIMAWLDKHARWDFKSGTSAHWLCTELLAEQALSETAPLLPANSAGYGTPARDRRPEPRVHRVEAPVI